MVPWHQPAPSHPQPLAHRAVSPQPSCPWSGTVLGFGNLRCREMRVHLARHLVQQ